MGVMASQITSLTIVYSTVYSGADQRKHQSSVTGLCVGWIPWRCFHLMTSSWHKSIVWVIIGWRRVFSEWRRSSCPSMGLHYNSARLLIFSCDQAALRTLISVRPSVCLSVCHSFWQCSCHRIILKFSGVITIDRCDVHAKGRGQRSRSQRSWPHLAVSGP